MIYTWVHFKKFFVKIFRLKTEKRKGDAEKFLKLVDNEESEAAEARPGWHRNKVGLNEILRLFFTTFTEDFLLKVATNINIHYKSIEKII